MPIERQLKAMNIIMNGHPNSNRMFIDTDHKQVLIAKGIQFTYLRELKLLYDAGFFVMVHASEDDESGISCLELHIQEFE